MRVREPSSPSPFIAIDSNSDDEEIPLHQRLAAPPSPARSPAIPTPIAATAVTAGRRRGGYNAGKKSVHIRESSIVRQRSIAGRRGYSSVFRAWFHNGAYRAPKDACMPFANRRAFRARLASLEDNSAANRLLLRFEKWFDQCYDKRNQKTKARLLSFMRNVYFLKVDLLHTIVTALGKSSIGGPTLRELTAFGPMDDRRFDHTYAIATRRSIELTVRCIGAHIRRYDGEFKNLELRITESGHDILRLFADVIAFDMLRSAQLKRCGSRISPVDLLLCDSEPIRIGGALSETDQSSHPNYLASCQRDPSALLRRAKRRNNGDDAVTGKQQRDTSDRDSNLIERHHLPYDPYSLGRLCTVGHIAPLKRGSRVLTALNSHVFAHLHNIVHAALLYAERTKRKRLDWVLLHKVAKKWHKNFAIPEMPERVVLLSNEEALERGAKGIFRLHGYINTVITALSVSNK